MNETDKPSPNATDSPSDGARRVVSVKGTKGDPMREARIKAALKANIARRKVQARVRNAGVQEGVQAGEADSND